MSARSVIVRVLHCDHDEGCGNEFELWDGDTTSARLKAAKEGWVYTSGTNDWFAPAVTHEGGDYCPLHAKSAPVKF